MRNVYLSLVLLCVGIQKIMAGPCSSKPQPLHNPPQAAEPVAVAQAPADRNDNGQAARQHAAKQDDEAHCDQQTCSNGHHSHFDFLRYAHNAVQRRNTQASRQ